MNNLTRAAVAVSSVGLVASGAMVATAIADSPAPNTTPAAPSGDSFSSAAVKARVFAVVRADGTKARGRGANSTSRVGTGVYNVRFDRRIGGCVWLGTVGRPDFVGTTGPGQVTITGLNGTRNGMFVTVFNGSGSPADLPFHVAAICS